MKFDAKGASGGFNGLNLYSNDREGNHVIRHSSSSNYLGSLIFSSEGTQGSVGGDFFFQRKNGSEDVKVNIGGELTVKTSIKSSSGHMEMRATADGWAFYAI